MDCPVYVAVWYGKVKGKPGENGITIGSMDIDDEDGSGIAWPRSEVA